MNTILLKSGDHIRCTWRTPVIRRFSSRKCDIMKEPEERSARRRNENDGTRRPDTRQSSFRFHPLGPYDDGIYASFSPSKWNSRAGESLPGYGLLWTRATLLLFRSRLTHDSINSYASNTCIFLLWNLITLLEMVLVTIRWIGILLHFESASRDLEWMKIFFWKVSRCLGCVRGWYRVGIDPRGLVIA